MAARPVPQQHGSRETACAHQARHGSNLEACALPEHLGQVFQLRHLALLEIKQRPAAQELRGAGARAGAGQHTVGARQFVSTTTMPAAGVPLPSPTAAPGSPARRGKLGAALLAHLLARILWEHSLQLPQRCAPHRHLLGCVGYAGDGAAAAHTKRQQAGTPRSIPPLA